MLNQIKDLTEKGKISVKESINIILKINSTYRSLYNLLYGNLITNFESNLTKKNLEEYRISQKEDNEILKNFEKWFQKADNNLKNPEKSIESNKELKKEGYLRFKQQLKGISLNGYKLLLDVEKSIEYPLCEKEISKFEIKIKDAEKKILKISDEI